MVWKSFDRALPLAGELSGAAGLRGLPLGLIQFLLNSRLGAPSVVESFGSANTSPSWRWWRTQGRSNVSVSKRDGTLSEGYL